MSAAQATPPPVSPSHAESSSRARGTPPTHFPHFILHALPTSFTQPHTVSRSPGHAQTHPHRSRPLSRWRWNHVDCIPTCRPNSSHTTRQNNVHHKITTAVSIAKPGTTMNPTAPPSRPRITFRTIAPRSPHSARATTGLRQPPAYDPNRSPAPLPPTTLLTHPCPLRHTRLPPTSHRQHAPAPPARSQPPTHSPAPISCPKFPHLHPRP